jgi:3-hydroxy-3-methylglutaryl CoA synthase
MGLGVHETTLVITSETTVACSSIHGEQQEATGGVAYLITLDFTHVVEPLDGVALLYEPLQDFHLRQRQRQRQ